MFRSGASGSRATSRSHNVVGPGYDEALANMLMMAGKKGCDFIIVQETRADLDLPSGPTPAHVTQIHGTCFMNP
jgi:hypothetical protein